MVYAFNTTIERRSLWEELLQIQSMFVTNVQLPWCLMGDFNTFINHFETNGVLPQRHGMVSDFKNCLQQLGVTDLRYQGEIFTWWDCNLDQPLMMKLDRVLVNANWIEKFDHSLATFLPRGLSDHCPATVQLGLPTERIFKPFQIFHHLLEDDDFVPLVEAAWQATVTGNPCFVLSAKLKAVKQGLELLCIIFKHIWDLLH